MLCFDKQVSHTSMHPVASHPTLAHPTYTTPLPIKPSHAWQAQNGASPCHITFRNETNEQQADGLARRQFSMGTHRTEGRNLDLSAGHQVPILVFAPFGGWGAKSDHSLAVARHFRRPLDFWSLELDLVQIPTVLPSAVGTFWKSSRQANMTPT